MQQNIYGILLTLGSWRINLSGPNSIQLPGDRAAAMQPLGKRINLPLPWWGLRDCPPATGCSTCLIGVSLELLTTQRSRKHKRRVFMYGGRMSPNRQGQHHVSQNPLQLAGTGWQVKGCSADMTIWKKRFPGWRKFENNWSSHQDKLSYCWGWPVNSMHYSKIKKRGAENWHWQQGILSCKEGSTKHLHGSQPGRTHGSGSVSHTLFLSCHLN